MWLRNIKYLWLSHKTSLPLVFCIDFGRVFSPTSMNTGEKRNKIAKMYEIWFEIFILYGYKSTLSKYPMGVISHSVVTLSSR